MLAHTSSWINVSGSMPAQRKVFIGTDGGATTSKIGAVWEDGTAVSTRLLQRPTGSEHGPHVTVTRWVDAIDEYLAANGLTWEQVGGVGLAIPGPYQRYGVFDHSPNLPGHLRRLRRAHHLHAGAVRAGRSSRFRSSSATTATWVASPRRSGRAASSTGTVVMLAPGSGLGCAFIDRNGLPLEGDTICRHGGRAHAGAAAPAGCRALPCGCGRTWGCVEVYTTLAGLPYLLANALERHPDHELAHSGGEAKQRAMALRGLAQKSDPLALEIFDFQARALGLHVASLAMALDPTFFVIGGGLMDPESTSPAFRDALPRRRPRRGRPVSLAGSAQPVDDRSGRARRSLAGRRRRAGRALPAAALTPFGPILSPGPLAISS